MYSTYIQVCSLITAQVVYMKEFPVVNLQGLDYYKSQLVIYGKKQPLLVSQIQ